MSDLKLHDHGTWKGPCSPERHALIESGKATDLEGEAVYRWFKCTIEHDGRAACACCGTVLISTLKVSP